MKLLFAMDVPFILEPVSSVIVFFSDSYTNNIECFDCRDDDNISKNQKKYINSELDKMNIYYYKNNLVYFPETTKIQINEKLKILYNLYIFI